MPLKKYKLCKGCGEPNESVYKHCLECRKKWRHYNLKRADPQGYKRRLTDLEAENAKLSKKIKDLQAIQTFILRDYKKRFRYS